MITIRVQAGLFDVGAETAALSHACNEAGAIASFLGIVRSTPARPIAALTLEHYPAMTQRIMAEIAQHAATKFALLGCTVIHRYGTLRPAEPIVLVLAAASHRQASLDGVAYLIDWLKTEAPFWKKEQALSGETTWIAAQQQDQAATNKWR